MAVISALDTMDGHPILHAPKMPMFTPTLGHMSGGHGGQGDMRAPSPKHGNQMVFLSNSTGPFPIFLEDFLVAVSISHFSNI